MSFSESSLSKKLLELTNTQQSVQTLSLWLIHHRKHSRIIVKSWYKELMNTTKCDRKLSFIYLANDILQNSRKKGQEYMQEFETVMNDSIENTARYADDKTRFTLERILNIWKDRKIFADEVIDKYKQTLHNTKPIDQLNSPPLVKSPIEIVSSKISKSSSSSNLKLKSKSSSSTAASLAPRHHSNDSKRSVDATATSVDSKKKKFDNDDTDKTSNGNSSSSNKKLALSEEVAKELLNGNVQAPESADLIIMLQDLEKSASSDAVVRKKIAELPTHLTELSYLNNIRDRNEAFNLLETINEAARILDDYNTRLQQELANRRKTALMLAAFIRNQQAEKLNDQKLIDEWQRKQSQVNNVKHELKVHLENLPDLSSIEEAAELIPLPSPGDLFSSNKALNQ